jgi:hypothetical protein
LNGACSIKECSQRTCMQTHNVHTRSHTHITHNVHTRSHTHITHNVHTRSHTHVTHNTHMTCIHMHRVGFGRAVREVY